MRPVYWIGHHCGSSGLLKIYGLVWRYVLIEILKIPGTFSITISGQLGAVLFNSLVLGHLDRYVSLSNHSRIQVSKSVNSVSSRCIMYVLIIRAPTPPL